MECGYSLAVTQGVVGCGRVSVEQLIDHGACLGAADRRVLTDRIDAFERRFPQVACTVFLGGLPVGVSAAEAGFWLVNHAVFQRAGGEREAGWALAVIIDPGSGEAALAAGYALEWVVTERVLNVALMAAAPHLQHREYVKATEHVLGDLDHRLRRLGRECIRSASGAANTSHLGLNSHSLAPVGADLPRAPLP